MRVDKGAALACLARRPIPFFAMPLIQSQAASHFSPPTLAAPRPCPQVLHLLLWRLVGRPPEPPSLLEFLRVDELLVDIRDDLVDYEEDVVRNAFNILRCFVHLYGQDAPLRLVRVPCTMRVRHVPSNSRPMCAQQERPLPGCVE